ncbi:MAG: hypothetical protein E3J72_15470 [Planctomycetota bacterium]|nr:MAG: hypothetical protein E3J72_15470 [Planctomycetota bacterium]
MQSGHEILSNPNAVFNTGVITVLKQKESTQSLMGEAITLDSIFNSIDGEIVAKGDSAKGPNRGSITRHGNYTLWGFAGDSSKMTDTGCSLFVNAAFYAAKFLDTPVLELRLNQTRDGLYTYLKLAKGNIGFLNTMKQYLPASMSGATLSEVEQWLNENRPYLRINKADGRRFEVDEVAKALGIPNHKRALLETLMQNLPDSASQQTLVRYTGNSSFGADAAAWQNWYDENKNYLFFSDCEGSVFKIDEGAKAQGIPSETLRGWSSEEINYRTDS